MTEMPPNVEEFNSGSDLRAPISGYAMGVAEDGWLITLVECALPLIVRIGR